jgi:adenosylhomocysteine nucleosidase
VKTVRVLVTFAVDAEFAPWRKLRTFRSFQYDDLQMWRRDSGDMQLTVLITGVGMSSAARAMDLMMSIADENVHFDVCVSSGLAGALQECIQPGDIIAPRALVLEQNRAGAEADRLEVDDVLRSRALEHGARSSDCLFTTNRVLVKASQKRECASRAQSVDMESFEIVKEAQAWGARCVVVRAISDGANEDLPIDFNRILSTQNQPSVGKVLLELVKNPKALFSLIRFGRQSQRAASALAGFLDGYCEALVVGEPQQKAEQVAAR